MKTFQNRNASHPFPHFGRHDRRGVTLLFVVSMIVLFLLMGTTFVVISNDYSTTAVKRGRLRLQGDAGMALLNRSVYDIIRGPDLRNVASPLRGHSLLADQYGYGYKAVVTGADFVNGTNDQLVRVTIEPYFSRAESVVGADEFGVDWTTDGWKDDITGFGGTTNWMSQLRVPADLDPDGDGDFSDSDLFVNKVEVVDRPGFYAGQVMTFTGQKQRVDVDGYLATYKDGDESMSTRVVDYRVETATLPENWERHFIVMPDTPFEFNLTDMVGKVIILNGRAFDGYGAGYLAGTRRLSDDIARPNYRSFKAPLLGDNIGDRLLSEYLTVDNSTNESYDAPDHQNMFLAYIGNLDGMAGDEIIPSFHRREFVFQQFFDNPTGVENRFSFRPVYADRDMNGIPDEHSTANQDFPNIVHPTTGNVYDEALQNTFALRPLDVDNNLDGIADSVWMDFALPLQTDGSGRLIKPLVAPLILDLDSRLNLNAHGDRTDAVAGNYVTRDTLLQGLIANNRGFGIGPADISLNTIFPGGYENLLIGTPDLPGRYGFDDSPGIDGLDEWAYIDFQGYPRGAFSATSNLGVLGGLFTSSPMDLRGRYGLGFAEANRDPSGVPVGMPVIDAVSSSWGNELANSPYEIQLLQGGRVSSDSPFLPTELEAIMRPRDRDSLNLPIRLAVLMGGGSFDSTDLQDVVTTDSYEVPLTPKRHLWINDAGGNLAIEPHRIADRLFDLLVANGVAHNDAVNYVDAMLAPEVVRGMPMNINRPFGNGSDDNGPAGGAAAGAGVVDEYTPFDTDVALNDGASAEELEFLDTAGYQTLGFDHDNDGTVNNADARSLFARHLFILAWLAAGEYPAPSSLATAPDPPDMNRDGDRDVDDIRALAQWAVNVVDFRDPDSIMTAFQFDATPFDTNGWSPSGDFVFGFERPELLMTETFGAHNRNTEDTPVGGDSGGGGTDGDWDSKMVPNASVYIELYNPNLTSNATQNLPQEIYNNTTGVDLTAMASDGESPVWRVVFTENRDDSAENATARRVYFIAPGATVEPVGNSYYFPDASITIPVVEPNEYAVMGSGGVEFGGNYRTTFGRRTDITQIPVDYTDPGSNDLRLDETRSFTLIPGTGISFRDGYADPLIEESRTCIAIPINRWQSPAAGVENRSLGISDPLEGYVAALGGTIGTTLFDTGTPGEGDGFFFDVGRDQPVDDQVGLLETREIGNHDEFRFAQLQRLANPLAAYDAATNPYISVDRSPVDLVVFNGNGDDGTVAINETDFRSLERGQDPVSGGGDADRNLWRALSQGFDPTADFFNGGADTHHFSAKMTQTLGALNMAFIDPMANDSTLPMPVYKDTGLASLDISTFENMAFPWLAWNDRPFVSGVELLSVPRGGGVVDNTGMTVVEDQTGQQYRGPANMLENFTLPSDDERRSTHLAFAGEGSDGEIEMLGGTEVFNNAQGDIHRILDFVEVPSRFIGTDFVLDATNTNATADGTGFVDYNAPNNRFPKYRNPGKININTISDERVWNALMGNRGGTVTGFPGAPFSQMLASRQGKGAGSMQMGTYQTFFGNPFRPADKARLVTPALIEDQSGEDRTDFLRKHPTASRRLLESTNSFGYQNASRSQYFANMPTIRMPNVATTRSSVFAIWLTIGYFEVDENGLLGKEVGSDSGEQVRNRGFFVYDRSIPVGFEPGRNHNVERGILVKSIIE